MIKVDKGAEPQVLHVNKFTWTSNLMSLVKKYGSYTGIPQKEKDAAIKYYGHPDISSALLGMHARAKCIYCETYTEVSCFANIEHFHPKSLYPKETFDWDNLFVSCSQCNTPKGNFDTVKEPFIHPVNDNPEEYLTFDELQYIPKKPEGIAYLKAKNVIDACNLKRRALVNNHATILMSFLETRYALRDKITEYKGRKTERKKLEDAATMLDSLVVLNSEASDDAQYAGYMRYLLRKYCEIREAVTIINTHKEDLGLPDGFKWSFNY